MAAPQHWTVCPREGDQGITLCPSGNGVLGLLATGLPCREGNTETWLLHALLPVFSPGPQNPRVCLEPRGWIHRAGTSGFLKAQSVQAKAPEPFHTHSCRKTRSSCQTHASAWCTCCASVSPLQVTPPPCQTPACHTTFSSPPDLPSSDLVPAPTWRTRQHPSSPRQPPLPP